MTMKNTRSFARTVGALMLSAFLLYGIGSSVATTAPAGSASLTVGVAMMLVNSIAVITIGVLMLAGLRPRPPVAAGSYRATRIFEGARPGGGATPRRTGLRHVA